MEALKWPPDPRDWGQKRGNYGQVYKVKAYHPLEVFFELGIEKIKEKMRRKLSGLKIVSYYSYLLTRPLKVQQFDNFENP